MDIIQIVFKALNFEKLRHKFPLRDPNDHEKYVGSDEFWEKAEQAIVEVITKKDFRRKWNMAKQLCYPKLDFMVKMPLVAVGSWELYR